MLLALAATAEPVRVRLVDVDVVTLDPSPTLSAAYRGAGWVLQVPGVAARGEWDLVRRTRTVTRDWRKRAERVRVRSLYGGLEAGASSWPVNDTLFSVQGVIGTRRTLTRGGFTGVYLSAGPMVALEHRSTYRVQDGTVQRDRLGGRLAAQTTLGWEIGAPLARRKNTDLAWFVRPAVSLVTPWTVSVVPVVHWDVGVRGRLPGGAP